MSQEMTQDRSVEIEMSFGKYSFREDEHAHKLNNKRLYSVTTKLKVYNSVEINKKTGEVQTKTDGLIGWGVKEVLKKLGRLPKTEQKKYIKKEARLAYATEYLEKIKQLNPEEFISILDSAATAYKKDRDASGSFGTHVHDAAENWVLLQMGKTPKKEVILNESEQMAFNEFTNWAINEDIEFLACEKHVASNQMWIGGILDLIFRYRKTGKINMADIKTAKSGVHDDNFYQMGGYDKCLQHMGEKWDFDGYTVINIPSTGGINVSTSYARERNIRAFEIINELFDIAVEIKKTT